MPLLNFNPSNILTAEVKQKMAVKRSNLLSHWALFALIIDSVTIWQDYMLNIWPFTTMQNCPATKLMTNSYKINPQYFATGFNVSQKVAKFRQI